MHAATRTEIAQPVAANSEKPGVSTCTWRPIVMSIRFARGIAVAGACVAIAACSKGGNNTDSAAAADPAPKASATTSPAAATPAPAALNNANIAALLDEVNMADSAAGNLASTKGT